MDFNKLITLIQTVRFIRPSQLFFQIYYKLKNKLFREQYNQKCVKVNELKFKPFLNENENEKFNSESKSFKFLNLSKSFNEIDWNYSGYGKLWTYNLNYFDYLSQGNLSKENGIKIMLDFCDNSIKIKDGFEPYPISLRGINWIKFISKNNIQNEEINHRLYNDYLRLSNNLEYHIQANHLLENIFSLFFAAHYFNHKKWLIKSEKLIIKELKEQILSDGAHYELSPMYHKIILTRILDAYNLATNNNIASDKIKDLLKNTARNMLSWLDAISFKNGEIPLINDSSPEITSTNEDIFNYSQSLGINYNKINLKESGYRKYTNGKTEILLDVGQISPSYQPGHSHADNLNFLMNYDNSPVIVDTGISTYEKNYRRQLERSSSSHNVITINNKNSSDVWSGFRVGKRANTVILLEKTNYIKAKHNGYRNLKAEITRSLQVNDDEIIISEKIDNYHNKVEGVLHFHPNCKVELNNNQIVINNKIVISFETSKLKLTDFKFCLGFNKLIDSTKVLYTFSEEEILKINLK